MIYHYKLIVTRAWRQTCLLDERKTEHPVYYEQNASETQKAFVVTRELCNCAEQIPSHVFPTSRFLSDAFHRALLKEETTGNSWTNIWPVLFKFPSLSLQRLIVWRIILRFIYAANVYIEHFNYYGWVKLKGKKCKSYFIF